MKVQIKMLVMALSTGLCLQLSCTKDKNPVKNPAGVLQPDKVTPQKSLLPVEIGTGKSKMAFSYQEKNSLKTIDYGDGRKSVLEYNSAGKPKSLLRYKDAELFGYTEYQMDKNSILIKARMYTVTNGSYFDRGSYVFSYNSESRLQEISYYDLKNILSHTISILYSSAGNLVSDQQSSDGLKAQYLYDDKNGLFKNVQYSWLFAIEEDNRLFYSCINNMKSYTFSVKPGLDQFFSYTYNTDGYPATISSTGKISALNAKVTYTEVKN